MAIHQRIVYDSEHSFPYTLRTVSDWSDLRQLLGLYGQHFVFRGHQRSAWRLSTSLWRLWTAEPFHIQAYLECLLVKEFKRNAHQFLNPNATPKSPLEWLAMMQHHGAPTRLLDWTRSPYVAAYFALEDARGADSCAIWAVHLPWLKERGVPAVNASYRSWSRFDESVSPSDQHYFDRIVRHGIRGVFHVEPHRLNERMTYQQGLFLFPGDPEVDFEENLAAMVPADREMASTFIHKIEVPNTVRLHAMYDLHAMSVSRMSLFPGIDGFAQSLRYNLSLRTRHDSNLGAMTAFVDIPDA